MNIWISTDLHLFTQDNDERHPFRSRHNLGQLSDQIATGISPEDLWIFLGDLCDPNVSDQNVVRQVVQSIPCRRFMCRGNHDQQDDAYYKELGFEVVAEVIRYHNIIFSHKPLRVALDEINIHGHLHTEQMSGLGPNHINAYASNWNDNDHPVLLEDLIASATVQDVAISKSDEDHINSKFEKYTSLDNDHYSNFYELVDEEPVIEAVGIPTILYHGSSGSYQTLKAQISPAYPDQKQVFATPSYDFALAFAGKPWSDLEINQSVVNGKQVLTEILPGMFKEKFNCPGYVHVLKPDDFTRFGRDSEWVADYDQEVIEVKRVSNVLAQLKRSDATLYEYPNLPPHIPDRKKYIETIITKYGMNTTYDKLKATYHLSDIGTNSTERDTLQEICKFCNYMDKTFQYGGLVKGKLKRDIDFDKEYIMQSPQQFEKSKVGVCWDYVSYEAWYFKKHFPDVKFKTYYAQFFNKGECPSHTFLFFQLGGTWYYFENSFRVFAGVYELPDEKSGANYVLKLMSDNPDPAIEKGELLKSYQYDIWEYNALDPSLYGMGCQSYMNYVMGNGKCWHHNYKASGNVKRINSGTLTESIGDIPRGYKPGYISSWQKDTDTVMDEILFQDAEETKYWMSDNDEYPKKKDQADQNKRNTSVVLDETAKHSRPKITAKISKTKNPNDGLSSTAVRLWFFNERKEEIGEASASAIDTNTAFLYDVEVFPAYRGKGYGYAIVEYMMEHYPITELTVEKSNKVAISLYKKFGFTKTMEFKENGKNMIDMKTPGAISESSTIDHTFDRDDKTKVAKKYGLTDVGRDDRVERSEKELAEMQRKDAVKKAKKTLDEKKKKRNKQLKKARNAKKRKAFIDKVKSKLPGVKQEDASAVDNPDIDWTAERDKRNIFDSHQDMEPYIQESYQFQLEEHVQFFDKLDEAAQKKQKYLPVYVVIMHTGTPLATIIKNAIGSEYSHASISFDSSLTNMYSFARKLSDTGKASHDGGFRKEDIRNPFFKEREVKYSMYMVPCTEDQIKLMQKRLEYFRKNQNNFTYDFTGLVKSYFHISDNPEYRWFCTRFVADILNAGRPTDPYIADPFLVRPDDFMETNFAMYVTSGYLDKYDQKDVDKITKRLLNQKKVQKFIQDSQNEMALDLPLDNPYERFVLNYQLSQMDESAVDQFLMYLKSFKIRFDANGDIRITRREYDQLDGHFRSSLKMIKACEDAGNVEGVKEELYKIHYMIELINTYYLKPYAKNYRPNTKEIRKDMMDLRSVMMNAFKQNLEWVTMKDPSYNFQRGYQVSTYGSETKIPHKVITHVGQTIATMLT